MEKHTKYARTRTCTVHTFTRTRTYNMHTNIQCAHKHTMCTQTYDVHTNIRCALIHTMCTHTYDVHTYIRCAHIHTMCTQCAQCARVHVHIIYAHMKYLRTYAHTHNVYHAGQTLWTRTLLHATQASRSKWITCFSYVAIYLRRTIV